jgi:eukaryotic-like serine/threonine-protein kinase
MQGRTLLQYHFLEKIGEGGMGLVYKARDETLGRLVAIKVLPDSRLEPSARSRFFREARAASALNHPNIITIHEIASSDGTEMIVMEYVDGHTLGELLRDGPLPLSDVFKYALQIADAVSKAHAAGVIHRDLKPGNIMITRDALVKVLDFGLAKMQASSSSPLDTAPTLELTGERVVLGTAAYMSPEQAAGEPLDTRTDIFSFGVILYEMIGGRRPFEGKTTLEVLRRLLAAEPVSLDALLALAPPDLLAIVRSALAKDREQRFSSMDQVRDALRAVQSGKGGPALSAISASDALTMAVSASETASLADSAPAPLNTAQPPRRTPLRWAVAIAAGSAVLIGLLAALPSLRGAPAGEEAATTSASSTSYQHYAAGQALMKRHDRRADVDRAIEEFTKSIDKDAGYAPGYAGLGDAYHRKNLLNADPQWRRLALDSATRAVELNPDLAVAQIAMGRALLTDGRLDDAERSLKRALELDATQPHAHLSLAAVRVARKDPTTAEWHYREALRLAPDDWQPLAELGQFLYRGARYQEAADAWERCAGLVPDNVTIHRQLGAAYHMLERPDDAARALQQALAIEPTASVYNNLGTLRFFQGRHADAVTAFKKAVEMRANSYSYWGNLADAHRWNPPTKDEAPSAYATAIQLAGDALKSKPEDGDLRATLALYRAKSGDAAGALKDIAIAEQAKQPSPSMLFKATVVYELAGNRQAALRALERTLAARYSPGEIRTEPELVSLRTDPRFHVLMSRAPRSESPR